MRTACLFFLACLLMAPLRAAGQDDILTKARAAATSGRRAEALSMLETHLGRGASRRGCAAALRPGALVGRTIRRGASGPAAGADAGARLHRCARRADERRVLVGPFHRSARAGRSDSGGPARQRHRPRGSRSNRGGEPSVVGRHELHARRVRRWNGALAGGLGVADPPDRRRLADHALEPRGAIRAPGQFHRGRVLSAFPARDVRLRRRRRRAGIGPFAVSPVSRGLRPVSVPRPRLRGVGRRAIPGLLSRSRRSTSARSRSTSATGCGPESSTTSPAKASFIRTPTSAGFAATSAATGPATSASTTATASAARRSAALQDLATFNSDTVRGEFDLLLGSRMRLSGSAGVSHQERPNRSPVWQTTITAGLSVQF